VKARRRRYRATHPGVVPATTHAPNDLWTADFKARFGRATTNIAPRSPWPISTRAICSRAPASARRGRRARRASSSRSFASIAIRTDNGVPFVTQAIHGLSYLNVWWMRLGIVHQRSRPGCPQDNGAHERMHRTLKRHAIKPVRATCAAQQRNFDAFRREYNTERPHERLNQETPASPYVVSPRPYPERLPPLEYPGHFLVKKVTTGGTFRFQSRLLYLANAMVDQQIGLEETDDGIWAIHFNTVLLATFDERDYIITG
jgi:putative transposase